MPFQGSQRLLRSRLLKLEAWLLVSFLALAGCLHGPRVEVQTKQGTVAIAVEVADTPDTRSYGLMYRKDLDANAGMLFVFPKEEVQSFWMKNTPLPLDMIFIGRDKHIVGIVENTKPFTTEPRSVGKPSLYVLEVHAGFSAAHSIRAGDTVEFGNVASARND